MKNSGGKRQNPRRRRGTALALSFFMAFGSAWTAAPAWAGAGQDQGSSNGLAGYETKVATETTETAGAESSGSGEVSLFSSVEGMDLRTYAAESDWYLGITNVQTTQKLETVSQSTDYGGNVVTTTYTNEPATAGNYFAIFTLALNKTIPGGDSFPADQMELTVKGTTYSRIADDGFLSNHHYTTFPGTEVIAGSKTGSVIFEVSPADAAGLAQWKQQLASGNLILQAGSIQGVAAEVDEDDKIAVPLGGYIAAQQYQTELDIMEVFQAGSYSIDSPLTLVNPYGSAPLTAVALFQDFREVTSVEVTVHGRTDNNRELCDVTYSVDTSSRKNPWYEIPIIGLYADYANHVTLTLKGKEGELAAKELTLQTEAVPSSGYTKVTQAVRDKTYPLEPGLTMAYGRDSVMMDANADVRWYTTVKTVEDTSTANLITERGTFWFGDTTYWSGDQANIYEMNWMGKVINHYLYLNSHHDMTELPNGNQLFICNVNGADKLVEVDKVTGAVVRETVMSSILNVAGQTGDWLHMNTVYSVGDGTLMLSPRNQDLVMRYDYEKQKVLWVLASRPDQFLTRNPQLANVLVRIDETTVDKNGLATEGFYHQHDAKLLPDLDNDPNTEDVTVFDNGAGRPNGSSYSRLVHYRIDKTTKTARQIFSWGKTPGCNFYTGVYGANRYMEQTGNYLGSSTNGHIVEIASNGAVAFRASVNLQPYRAFKVSFDLLPMGYHEMGTLKGRTLIQPGKETQFTAVTLEDVTGSSPTVALDQLNLYEGMLTIKGSAYLTSGAKKSVSLVADNGKDQYAASLLSGSTANAFDNTGRKAVPIALDRLPAGRYNLGILVTEDGVKGYKATNYYIEKKGSLVTVSNQEDSQREIIEELQTKAADSGNTIYKPVVTVNPFGKTPLSALAAFHTNRAAAVTVTVKGKPASGDQVQADVTYTVDGKTTDHVIPIVGLYADYENTVELATSEGKRSVVRIRTGALDMTNLRTPEITAAAAQKMEALPGLTFLTPAGGQTVPSAVDINGELRWAYLCAAAAPLETKPLRDGHFLVPSDKPSTEVFVTDAETALEIDLAGRVYGEYFLDGQPHHEVVERANGNLIFALSRRNHTSIEDYMVEVERSTGKQLRMWDMHAILGIPEYDASYDSEAGGTDDPNGPHRANPSIVASAGNHPYSDWFHQNALSYEEGDPADPSDDAIYVSGRHQSMIVKINAQKAEGRNPQADCIEWIYTDPSWLPQSSRDLAALLLKPLGAENGAVLSELESSSLDISEPDISGSETANPEAANPEAASGEAATEGAAKTETPDQQTKTGNEKVQKPELDQQSQSTEDSNAKESGTQLEETNEGTIGWSGLTASLESDLPASNTAQSLEEDSDADVKKNPETKPSLETKQSSGTEQSPEPTLAAATAQLPGGSEHPYVYGPHAVELMENGDLLIYDNFLYGSKLDSTANPTSKLFSRAIRLRVNDQERTFNIEWEYGQELGSSHYTPFIGDVDFLGNAKQSVEGENNHYLINFGGITRNAAGDPCDVVAAMLGGTISANVVEYKNGQILWSADFKGSAGRVSSVYRAERTDLSKVPFTSADYAVYTEIGNRGMYENTPQADISAAQISGARAGNLTPVWTMLRDEGNRLIGKFSLPETMTQESAGTGRVEAVYVLLDMGQQGRRVYQAEYVNPLPALGVTKGYYKFEIARDSKQAEIKLLLKRADGVWILDSTGEMVTSGIRYVTGETPVIDPESKSVSVKGGSGSSLLTELAEQAGTEPGTLIFVEKGALEPTMCYLYVDPKTKAETAFRYSELYGAYLALVPGTVTAAEAEQRIQTVKGTAAELRTGIVSDSRDVLVQGAYRTSLVPQDFFFVYNQLKNGTLPYWNTDRTLAMDVNGDQQVTSQDVLLMIQNYVYGTPFVRQ